MEVRARSHQVFMDDVAVYSGDGHDAGDRERRPRSGSGHDDIDVTSQV